MNSIFPGAYNGNADHFPDRIQSGVACAPDDHTVIAFRLRLDGLLNDGGSRQRILIIGLNRPDAVPAALYVYLCSGKGMLLQHHPSPCEFLFR